MPLVRFAVFFLCLQAAFAASSATSSTCTYSLAPASAMIPSTGGVAAISLATAASCPWSATTSVSWIIILTGSSGTGSAVIGYQVLANITGAPRTATITVAGQTHTITQPAATSSTCSYSLSPTTSQIPATGGAGSFIITTTATCQWTASTSASWITIQPAAGTGPATINYQATANTATAPRTATITVAGQTHAITQPAATATPAPSLCVILFTPATATAAAKASSGNVDLRTAAGCTWTLSTSAPWLSATPGSGTGPAKLQWSVAENTAIEPRTASITSGDAAFQLTQHPTTPSGAPSITSIVNDADLTAAIAPGMRILVRGASLAAAGMAIEKPPCLTSMAGVAVDVISGSQTIPAALFSIAPDQLGVQLPYSLPSGDAGIIVRHPGGASAAFPIALASTAPRIYKAQHEDGSPVTEDNPASAGAILDLLVSGLGAVTPAIAPTALSGDGGILGPAQRTIAEVRAFIGGRPAEVLYAGLVAASAGQYAVRLRIPEAVEPGESALIIATEDADSPPLTFLTSSPWTDAGGAAIDASGGEVEAGGVTIAAESGVLPNGATLRVRRAEASSEILIEGIPEERSGPLTLAFDSPPSTDGETLVAIKEVGFPGLTFFRASSQDGKATITVPASPVPPPDEKSIHRAARGPHRFSWMAHVIAGWDYRTSPKGLFTVFYDRAHRQDLSPKVDLILEALDSAYSQLGEKLRLSWEARKQWPIEVTLCAFTGADKDKWGTEGSIRFGKEGQTLSLNTRFMTTEKEMRFMVGTAAHELFHLLQNLYDSRFGIAIASQGANSRWLWFEEAASTWFERFVVSEPETYIPSTLAPDLTSANSSDNFAFLKQGLGQTRSQEHGYGASMFFQFLSDELGPQVIGNALKKISSGTPSSNFEDPVRAIQDAIGGYAIVKYWADFCQRYFAGSIYGGKLTFPTAHLFAGMTGDRHVFSGSSDTGKTVTWKAPPLSANVILINSRNANFAPDTPLRIRFHDANHYPSPAHIYRMRVFPDGTTTWTKAAEPNTRFEFLNAESLGPNNESLLIMAVNPWGDEGNHSLSIRAGQPKFKNVFMRLNTGGSFRTETISDGAYANPQVTIKGNEVIMTNYTTSLQGSATYSMRIRFVVKGALLETLAYSFRSERQGDIYEYQLELKDIPRVEVTNSFDDDGNVRWFVFEAGTPASKTSLAGKVVKYYGMRTFQGKQYPQEWNDRQSIMVRLIAPDPE